MSGTNRRGVPSGVQRCVKRSTTFCKRRRAGEAAGPDVEDFDEPRTKPAERRVSARRGWAGEKVAFFSILLVRLLGTVKADNKLDRTMVGFAAGTGAGDLGFPVCGFVVESAECFSTLGDGRPGFVGSGDIGHEAACRERDVTALQGLSLRHAETTRLFRSGGGLVERLSLGSGRRQASYGDENQHATTVKPDNQRMAMDGTTGFRLAATRCTH